MSKKIIKSLCIILIVLIVLNIAMYYKETKVTYNYTDEEVISEILFRVHELSKHKREVNIISLTPFVWSECYIINHDLSKSDFRKLVRNKANYKNIEDSMQRIIFIYNNKPVIDIVYSSSIMYIDTSSRKIGSEGYEFKIVTNNSRIVLKDK